MNDMIKTAVRVNKFGIVWNTLFIIYEAYFIVHNFRAENWGLMGFHMVAWCFFVYMLNECIKWLKHWEAHHGTQSI